MAETFSPSWWPAWKYRVAKTRGEPAFRAWLGCQAIGEPNHLDVSLGPPRRGGAFTFKYDGGLAGWALARRRGWAACAEVGAYAAAAAELLWPDRPLVVLLEGGGGNDEAAYQHLRVAVGGDVIDPFSREARQGEAQTVDWQATMTESWFRRSNLHLGAWR